MRRRPSERAARGTSGKTLIALAVLVLLLCGGGLAVQKAGAVAHRSHASVTGHAGLDGPYLPTLVESADSEDVVPVGSEYLNTLVPGLFLVSLALLLGSALTGSAVEGRLLELSRLPSVVPKSPSRGSLSALEVFRL